MQNFVNAVCIGFGVGLNAIISICLGAGQKGTADVAATHGVFLAVIHGLVMTAGCIWAVPSFLRAFTQDAGLIDLGLRYAVIVFAFSTILSVDLVYEKMFQAVGRMQVTMPACPWAAWSIHRRPDSHLWPGTDSGHGD